jgi:lambda family phage portal protein
MNWIDRAIAAVAPVTGVRRAQARMALAHVRSSEQRSRKRFVDRGDTDWGRNTGVADDARPVSTVDRHRVLRMVKRDPFARKALNTLVNNTVGWGITGAPKKAPATFRKLWTDWLGVCDYYGRLNFYGLQELAVRTMFRDGEIFVLFHQLSLVEAAGTVPLRLQLLDAPMLATSIYTYQGRDVVNGIEYDARGKVVAYHFYTGRPTQRWANYQTERYLAADVVHLFIQEDVGQRHGDSIFESVVDRLGDIDESIDAEIIRQKIQSCFTAFVTPSTDAQEPIGTLGDEAGPDGMLPETMTPGMILRTREGEQVSFGTPRGESGLNNVLRLALLASAAGTGITYEHFGDLSNVNFSSYKAGNLEFQRSTGRIQFNTIIPIFLDRVAARFQDAAFLAGMMPNRTYEMNWSPPPFESIDRLGDAQADILEMAAGLESRPNLVTSRGRDPDQLRAEIAADRKSNKDLDLVFAGDAPPTQYAAAPEAQPKAA